MIQGKIDDIDLELWNIDARLSRLYDSLEIGKLELDDLAPRIKELRTRKEELSKVRIQVEAEQIVEGVRKVDISIVKSYAKELHVLLEDAEISERKAFLKSSFNN